MILVRGRRRPRQERPFVAPSVAPSVAPPDSSPPSESKTSEQPNRTPGPKSLAATSIPKYSKDDLQRILKTVLETQAPAPTPAISETPKEKLKVRSPDVYCKKSHMDCYNFCQQCEDYFAIAGATGPIQILFAASFFWDWISFRW